jgi:uncharacterized membrane-anchored protein
MKKIFSFLSLFLLSISLYAGNEGDSLQNEIEKYIKYIDSVNSAMKYETGTVKLENGIAEMVIPTGFKYLNKEQSNFVIEKVWGNLPQDNIQGMLFPYDSNPFDDSSFAFIITYKAIGFVKDEDADKMDYDQLMKDMKAGEEEENKQRAAAGVQSLHTIGWAQKPYYDKTNKVLHWALNLKAEGADENTLNYSVMILGRKGLLSMNAVAPLFALDSVKNHISEVLAMPKFTDGNKYSDFNPDVDNVAAWTIGGLVAGKILTKVGILAGLGKFLKLIIIGIAALGGAIWKWITGRRNKQDEQYTPVTIDESVSKI